VGSTIVGLISPPPADSPRSNQALFFRFMIVPSHSRIQTRRMLQISCQLEPGQFVWSYLSRQKHSIQDMIWVVVGLERVNIMADGFKSIIADLEQQKRAIERALEALRDVSGGGEGVTAPVSTKRASAPAKRKGGLTAEGRRRLAEAMKRRWAVKRSAAQARKRGRKAA
jgi:hypothetical protein